MMSSLPKQNIDIRDWRTDDDEFDRILSEGFERAAKKAIASHHREGRSVPIWQDGKVMYLNPDGSVTEQNPTPETPVSSLSED